MTKIILNIVLILLFVGVVYAASVPSPEKEPLVGEVVHKHTELNNRNADREFFLFIKDGKGKSNKQYVEYETYENTQIGEHVHFKQYENYHFGIFLACLFMMIPFGVWRANI